MPNDNSIGGAAASRTCTAASFSGGVSYGRLVHRDTARNTSRCDDYPRTNKLGNYSATLYDRTTCSG